MDAGSTDSEDFRNLWEAPEREFVSGKRSEANEFVMITNVGQAKLPSNEEFVHAKLIALDKKTRT